MDFDIARAHKTNKLYQDGDDAYFRQRMLHLK
jgi:hypothetical protein